MWAQNKYFVLIFINILYWKRRYLYKLIHRYIYIFLLSIFFIKEENLFVLVRMKSNALRKWAEVIPLLLYLSYFSCQSKRNTYTVWCNQMETVFAQMSSWTALTWHLRLKTAFYTKFMKRKYFHSILLCKVVLCKNHLIFFLY